MYRNYRTLLFCLILSVSCGTKVDKSAVNKGDEARLKIAKMKEIEESLANKYKIFLSQNDTQEMHIKTSIKITAYVFENCSQIKKDLKEYIGLGISVFVISTDKNIEMKTQEQDLLNEMVENAQHINDYTVCNENFTQAVSNITQNADISFNKLEKELIAKDIIAFYTLEDGHYKMVPTKLYNNTIDELNKDINIKKTLDEFISKAKNIPLTMFNQTIKDKIIVAEYYADIYKIKRDFAYVLFTEARIEQDASDKNKSSLDQELETLLKGEIGKIKYLIQKMQDPDKLNHLESLLSRYQKMLGHGQ